MHLSLSLSNERFYISTVVGYQALVESGRPVTKLGICSHLVTNDCDHCFKDFLIACELNGGATLLYTRPLEIKVTKIEHVKINE